ncbi:MAG: 4Fe-4S binding protein [Fervidicoccaceae archaeon]
MKIREFRNAHPIKGTITLFPKKKVVIERSCNNCGLCVEICPTNALSINSNEVKASSRKCIACYACVILCPRKAIKIEWFNGIKKEIEIEDNFFREHD